MCVCTKWKLSPPGGTGGGGFGCGGAGGCGGVRLSTPWVQLPGRAVGQAAKRAHANPMVSPGAACNVHAVHCVSFLHAAQHSAVLFVGWSQTDRRRISTADAYRHIPNSATPRTSRAVRFQPGRSISGSGWPNKKDSGQQPQRHPQAADGPRIECSRYIYCIEYSRHCRGACARGRAAAAS